MNGRRHIRVNREDRRQASQERLHAKERGKQGRMQQDEERRRQREFALEQMRQETEHGS